MKNNFEIRRINTFSKEGNSTQYRMEFDRNDVGAFQLKELESIHSHLGKVIQEQKEIKK